MSLDTELSDFNWHFLSQYGRIKFYAAGRFWDAMHFDKAPINPYRLACEFYARNGFTANPDDFYTEGNRVRYRSIDKLVQENPEKLSDVGQMLFDSWLGFKKNLDSTRAKEPELPRIPPPNPMPPSLPKIQLPQEKKPRPEWVVKSSVWFTVLTPVMLVASYFIPPPWNLVAKALLEVLKFLLGG
jgi:hypothetical protein